MGLLRKPEDADQINLKINKDPSTIQDIVKTTEETFNNRIPINYKLEPDVYKGILAYVRGYPVKVDYYKKLNSYINKQTTDIEIPNSWNDVINKAYDLIRNMDMKLESQINLDIDQEQTEFELTGTGTIYPGIDPHVGDMFLMKINNTDIGVFVVNNVTPLSYHSDSFYKIDFSLYKILDELLMSYIQTVTINTYIFDKDTYFTYNYAILKDTKYDTLEKTIKALNTYISDLIYNQYDDVYNTLTTKMIIDDNEITVYDPLIVEFYNMLVDTNRFRIPTQLLTSYIDKEFKRSIWFKILKYDTMINTITNNKQLICKLHPRQFDVTVTSLINKCVIFPVKDINTYKNDPYYSYRYIPIGTTDELDNLPYYVFTEDFYKFINNTTYDENNLSTIEKLLIAVLKNEYTDETITTINDTLLNLNDNSGSMNQLYYRMLSIFILTKYKIYLKTNI